MKEYGVIKEYDGYCGTISSVNDVEYLVLKKDILYDNVIKKDIVVFVPEILVINGETKNTARYVEKK